MDIKKLQDFVRFDCLVPFVARLLLEDCSKESWLEEIEQ
jgi:hypothetical protein